MTQPDHLPLTSLDIAEDRKAQLRQTFPEVFREDKIDFDALKRALGEWVAPEKERFGLNWPGKAECSKLIQRASVGTLLPMRKQSVNFDTTENLIIEGDNLEVLKLLQKSYYGKVKMIYIDPPYNTGNEFIYPDNFHEGLQDYLKYSGQVDVEGRKHSTNTESGGRYHSNWLSMMYPRLFMARNLLREDGAIFISIDDNEAHNLRGLMDELFGTENFVANIIWKHTQQSKNDERYFSRHHNSIVVYKKSEQLSSFTFERTDDDNKAYSNPDNDSKGPWRSGDVRSPNYRESLRFVIKTPSGKSIDAPENGWRWKKETLDQKLKTGEIFFSNDEARIIRKIYLHEQEGRTPENLWLSDFAGTTRNANAELKELFDNPPFDTPKPTQLIKRMLNLVTPDGEGIVLDFFAGSGTTAHAIMELNKGGDGKRKFILVQLPEPTDNPDYPTIADITRERVRRVSARLQAEQAAVVPDLLTPADDTKTAPDFGFKAFRLAASNFKVWDGSAEQIADVGQTLELFADHVLDGRSAEDMLYELLLKTGFALTTPVTSLTLAGKQVFSAADGALLICLERELSLEVIESMVARDPFMMLCLDAGFEGKDELKVNAMQTVRAHNRNRQSSISLKVV